MALPYRIDPQPAPHERVIHPTPQDAALVLANGNVRAVEPELPGSRLHAYLDNVIDKPWGHEIRVYDDRRIDVWQLRIEARSGTSLHAHRRKQTCLICIEGRGVFETGSGQRLPLTVGTVVHIRAGALHATSTETGMSLVEVETPRDKFDLVRIGDSYGRTGEPYEDPRSSQPQSCPLVAQRGGPPQARLRRHSVSGAFRFNLESGAQARRRPDELIAAICLRTTSVTSQALTVLRSHALTVHANAEPFLTVRSNH
jgi:quercetin dioxygenase-like cupin family protein